MATSVRLLTYNVHQLRDDVDAVRTVLASCGADVVALQEPPRGPRGATRLRRLAWSAGYRVAVVGGAARTAAVLVRTGVPFSGGHGVRLRWHPGHTRRGLAVVDVAGIRFVSVHLSLFPAERARHLLRLLVVVGAAPGPCVVAGDLNEDPGGPTRRRLALHLHEVTGTVGPTFSSRRPRRRIDAVLVSRGVRATGAHVLAATAEAGIAAVSGWDEVLRRASDHLPVVVDLQVD